MSDNVYWKVRIHIENTIKTMLSTKGYNYIVQGIQMSFAFVKLDFMAKKSFFDDSAYKYFSEVILWTPLANHWSINRSSIYLEKQAIHKRNTNITHVSTLR